MQNQIAEKKLKGRMTLVVFGKTPKEKVNKEIG
jgi:hypothetical protein